VSTVTGDGNAQADLSTLEERYELVREIGRGATALVYLARDRVAGTLVAIKAIRGEFAQDPEVAGRFEREARTAAALDHPNIVRIFAVARLEGRALAIVMQYVPGGTLREALRARPQLTFEEAERVLRDMAAALAYARANGVVHRDVKPENIFLEEGTGRALLSDFGIARSLESDHQLTMTGSAIGTPTYMSPEQIDGLTADGRSDLYSLGLVGWEMLAGQRPWQGESLYNVIYKQKHERLPRLDELRPGIPPSLLFAIEGALLKRREDRWASADEFLERLSDHDARARPEPAEPAAAGSLADAPTMAFRRPPPAVTGGPEDVVVTASDGAQEATPAVGGKPTPSRPTRAARARARLPMLVWLALPLLFALGLALARARDARRARRGDARPATPAATAGSSQVATARGTLGGALTDANRTRAAPADSAAPDSGALTARVGDSAATTGVPAGVPAQSAPDSAPAGTSAALPATAPDGAPAAPPAGTGSAAGTIARRCASPAAADQRACLTARLAEHDRDLNAIYGELIRRMRRRARARAGVDPPDVTRLRTEQRAWIAQRDIECRQQGRGREGRLWAPVRAACLGEIAAYRADELRERLRGL
jgi:uncharacterized protein YecT (DUF1311 family)